MNYRSTRAGTPPTSLSDAILAGLAPDGGLFVPEMLPRLGAGAFDGAASMPSIAQQLLAPFFAGDRLGAALPALCTHAYAFDAPLVALADGRSFVLELFHGPTAAFKDFGARFLAAAMAALRAPGAPEVTVLVATSGDTGSAVGAAFHRQPGVRVVILYPDGRVSPRQAHQLGSFGDNVEAFKVAGSFDDCQRMVKQAFGDAALRDRRPLASANSISLGRLLPQMGYYASAALNHRRAGRAPLNVIVPTGNLGNAFAAVLARAIGLPIGDIVLASLANAMDVGNPSNAERLRWLFPRHVELADAVSAHWVDDDSIRARITEGEAHYGQVWCPHTACAVEVLERLRRDGDARDWAVVATAHPAKFETVVEPLVGHRVAPPAALAAMLERPARADALPADYAALRGRLLAEP
jgi:threonine synthase